MTLSVVRLLPAMSASLQVHRRESIDYLLG
jgi:hypothetical protein